ncbi:Beta-centractin [Trichinella spiralis]|uniref:Beta-centractin n=1 Tax=Trichinella spiralis TaxID=6334 RepID=A0ABR3KU93_TRISP
MMRQSDVLLARIHGVKAQRFVHPNFVHVDVHFEVGCQLRDGTDFLNPKFHHHHNTVRIRNTVLVVQVGLEQ